MISIKKKDIRNIDYVGTIAFFQSNAIPPGWIKLTYNLELNPSAYPKLFNKIGYKFGTGSVNNTYFKPPSLFDSNGKYYHLKKVTNGAYVGVKADAYYASHGHSTSVMSDGSHAHTFPSAFFLEAGTYNRRKNSNGTVGASGAYGVPPAARFAHSTSHSHTFTSGSVIGQSTGYIQKIILKSITTIPCIYHGEI